MMKRILFFVLASLVLNACTDGGTNANPNIVLPLATAPAEYAGQTSPLGEDAVAEGAVIFKTNCKGCHGPEGHGNGPASQTLNPRPMNLAELQAVADDDYLYWRINTGKDGTAMVAWKGILTDEQIWQVVAFIDTLK